ncbi:MAG: Hsp20/alpha crystallin family protein [Candidatus Paceibacterota bacterium]
MAFLQRLKGKQEADKKDLTDERLKGVTQLEVDLYQTDEEIIVFAPIPGAKPESLDISIKGDDDVVVISGTSKRPEDLAFNKENRELGKFFTEEVIWGDFYRKIILPEQVNIKAAEAKMKLGVLVLHLPLITEEEEGDKAVKLNVVDIDDFKKQVEGEE